MSEGRKIANEICMWWSDLHKSMAPKVPTLDMLHNRIESALAEAALTRGEVVEPQRCLHGKTQDEHCKQCVIDSEAEDTWRVDGRCNCGGVGCNSCCPRT